MRCGTASNSATWTTSCDAYDLHGCAFCMNPSSIAGVLVRACRCRETGNTLSDSSGVVYVVYVIRMCVNVGVRCGLRHAIGADSRDHRGGRSARRIYKNKSTRIISSKDGTARPQQILCNVQHVAPLMPSAPRLQVKSFSFFGSKRSPWRGPGQQPHMELSLCRLRGPKHAAE